MDPVLTQGVTPQLPLPVQTFGKGGQRYIANLFSGFIINGEKIRSVFNFAQNDSNVAFAAMLTNMREAGRIGSTMNFTAMQMGLRAVKLGDTPPTNQEIHDIKRFMASQNVEITVGSNNTRVAEFTGAHLLNVMEFSSATTLADTYSGQSSPVNQTAWINLPEPIGMESNVEIGGQMKCNLTAVPASLQANGANWAILVVFAGIKQTK